MGIANSNHPGYTIWAGTGITTIIYLRDLTIQGKP